LQGINAQTPFPKRQIGMAQVCVGVIIIRAQRSLGLLAVDFRANIASRDK
jgi:hypothetical protein